MGWRNRYSSRMNRSSWKTAHEDAHPNIEDMDDLQSHLKGHHEGDFIGDEDDHEWFHSDPKDYIDTHRGLLFPIEPHDPDHWHTNNYERSMIPDALPPSFAGFHRIADMDALTLRGEGAPAFTEPGYQDDQDSDEQTVGPYDMDSNATNVTKFPKSVGVFKNSSWQQRFAGGTGTWGGAGGSEFGNPIDYNENRMQSLQSPGLGVSYPLDSGKRNYTEQRQDANPIPLRSWFTGDDVNGPWPHTKNLSGPLDFEPTDDQNKDSTGPVTGSFNSKVTSSWHQSNVSTFDTEPDQDTPDTLFNPADELKNGRPRANDLPQQSAQLIPGMLIDHDQMGGSGTASGSF